MGTAPAPSPPMLPLCFCLFFLRFLKGTLQRSHSPVFKWPFFSINFIESNSTTFRKYDGGGKYAPTINCLRKGNL